MEYEKCSIKSGDKGGKKAETIMMQEEIKKVEEHKVDGDVFGIADQMESHVIYIEDMKKTLHLMEQGFFALRSDNKEIEMSCVRMIQRQLGWLSDEIKQCRARLLELNHVPEDS